MAYYICGKSSLAGTIDSDSANQNLYTELGVELYASHIAAKHLWWEQQIQSDDVIVTSTDRMFLYQAVFPHVISYAEFVAKKTDAIDLLAGLFVPGHPNQYPWNHFLSEDFQAYRYPERQDLIQQMNLVPTANLHHHEPFFVVCHRQRGHNPGNNTSDSFSINLISNLLKRVPRVFVVGKGNEKLALNKQIIPITLQEYASLIQDPLCQAVIGPVSGILQVALLVSQAPKILALNFGNTLPINYDGYSNPLFGKQFKFSPSILHIIDPNRPQELYNFL